MAGSSDDATPLPALTTHPWGGDTARGGAVPRCLPANAAYLFNSGGYLVAVGVIRTSGVCVFIVAAFPLYSRCIR